MQSILNYIGVYRCVVTPKVLLQTNSACFRTTKIHYACDRLRAQVLLTDLPTGASGFNRSTSSTYPRIRIAGKTLSGLDTISVTERQSKCH